MKLLHQSRWATRPADGNGLHTLVWGSAHPTTVLIHGSGEGAYVWNEVASAFADSHTLTGLDRRGHGDSPWDSRSCYSIDDYVSDVRTLLREFGIHACKLVGHSLGGAVAARVAATEPARISHLMLVDYGPGTDPAVRAFVQEEFRAQLRRYGSAEEYVALLRERRPLVPDHTLRYIAANALRPISSGGFELKCDPALASIDAIAAEGGRLEEDLARIGCDTLVVRGRVSAVLSAANASAMLRVLKHGQLVSVSGAGHAVMTDNPTQFIAAMARFLAA
jgi:3-oxoadipate enol-lactonase